MKQSIDDPNANPERGGSEETGKRRVFTWLARWCEWKRWWQIPLLLVVIYLPAFGMGQVMDDYHFETAFQSDDTLSLDLLLNSFNFGESKDVNGERYRNRAWWSAPDFKMHFLRPTAAFSLWLDYRLLSLPLRHLHSLLWYGFLLWGLAGFYRRALAAWNSPPGSQSQDQIESGRFATPEKIAFLALLLFAVNDAHALPVAWVAHRSLIIALGFAIWALRFFEAGLRGEKHARILGPLFFLLALSGGEAALGSLAYMLLRLLVGEAATGAGNSSPNSHAAGQANAHRDQMTGLSMNPVSLLRFTSPGELIRRLTPLAPYAAIAVLYLAAYSLGGFGTFQSGLYLNPLREPLAFLTQFAQSWPILVGALLGPISAAFYGLRDAVPGIVWFFLVPAGLLVFALNWIYLRPMRDRTGAFLFGAAMLALIPACMAAPGDRLLMLAGVGVYPLLARFLLEGRGWFWWALLIGHLLLSSLNVSGTIRFFADYGAFAREKITELQERTPVGTPADRRVVLINGPGICLGLQFRHLYNAHFGTIDPENYVMLANNLSTVEVNRVDANTLEIVTDYPGRTGARVFRRPNEHLAVGQTVSKNFTDITVLEMDAHGWPARIRVRFSGPLNEIAFVAFHEDEYRYITPPAVGGSLTIPAPADADSKLYL